MQPITPGEILNEEFLLPLGISQYKLAKDINVPAIRIHAIINGKRAITPDTALRLAKYFSTTPQFWLNLQNQYELDQKGKSMEQELKTKVLVCERVIHPKKRKSA
jgi:addiction module HigA family antidote